MWDNKQEDRYKLFIKAFGIEIGDKIKIPGWFHYEAKEDGFYQIKDGYKKGHSAEVFNVIIERGFERINA